MEPDIGAESRFLLTPSAHDAPIGGGFCQNILMMFGMEKLEWCSYPTVKQKKLKICLFVLTDYTNVTDRWTDTA